MWIYRVSGSVRSPDARTVLECHFEVVASPPSSAESRLPSGSSFFPFTVVEAAVSGLQSVKSRSCGLSLCCWGGVDHRIQSPSFFKCESQGATPICGLLFKRCHQ